MSAYNDVIVDESCFPLIYQVFPAHLDMETFDRYALRFERCLQRGEAFVSVADASAVTERAVPIVRKRLADWSRTIEADVVRLSKGDARIVKSALIRGAMTAVNWLHKTPVAQEWFTSSDEATRWAIARLDQSNVFVPSNVRSRALLRIAT